MATTTPSRGIHPRNHPSDAKAGLTEKLNSLLSSQTHDGFVDFNAIAKRITTVPEGIPVLLKKSGMNDVMTNLINMRDGDETRVKRKQGTTYYTDPRIAIAFIRLNCKDIGDEIARWEALYGRADVPEQLGQNAPALLRHLMSVFDNSKFRCTFQDGKWWFCLHDIVQAATGDRNNTGRSLDRALALDNTLLNNVKSYGFYGSTEMQIVDINTAARVWMVLPGTKASIFRATLADLFIRTLGGDPHLANEITEIGEFQDTLPENHPLRTLHRKTTSSTTPTDPTAHAFQRALSGFADQVTESIRKEFQQREQAPPLYDLPGYLQHLKDVIPQHLEESELEKRTLRGELDKFREQCTLQSEEIGQLQNEVNELNAAIDKRKRLRTTNKERRQRIQRVRNEYYNALNASSQRLQESIYNASKELQESITRFNSFSDSDSDSD